MIERLREKIRIQILSLVGRDIEDIARRAYDDGCYVTTNRMRAEKTIEFAAMVAQNRKLQEVLSEHISLTMPPIIIERETSND